MRNMSLDGILPALERLLRRTDWEKSVDVEV